MNYITENDMVFTNDNEKGIYSGGFKVDSIMMKLGISPIATINKNKNLDANQSNVSDLFSHMVVPNWVAYYPNKKGGEKIRDEIFSHDNEIESEDEDEDTKDYNEEENEDTIIGGAIYDRLLELATINENELKQNKKNKTKRNRTKTVHKKTSKNR